jgi:hypothetical protein
MNDALWVGNVECVVDLKTQVQQLFHLHVSTVESRSQRLTVDEFHSQIVQACSLFQRIDRRYVRMVERGEHARFAFETLAYLAGE